MLHTKPIYHVSALKHLCIHTNPKTVLSNVKIQNKTYRDVSISCSLMIHNFQRNLSRILAQIGCLDTENVLNFCTCEEVMMLSSVRMKKKAQTIVMLLLFFLLSLEKNEWNSLSLSLMTEENYGNQRFNASKGSCVQEHRFIKKCLLLPPGGRDARTACNSLLCFVSFL